MALALLPEPIGLAYCLGVFKTPISGGVLFAVGDFGKLATVLESDGTSLVEKASIEVLTGEEPRCKIGAGLGISGGETDLVVVNGIAAVLFVGGLALVDSEDCPLDGVGVRVDEVDDLVLSVGLHLSSSLFLKLEYQVLLEK